VLVADFEQVFVEFVAAVVLFVFFPGKEVGLAEKVIIQKL
jgi:hypothetical protein